MGTHPIFESDFDCLTEKRDLKMPLDRLESEYGSDTEGYVGLQERMNRITNETPDRFRRDPVQIEKAKNRPRVTRARSPKFATNSRARLRGARDENRPQLKEKTKRRARVGAPRLATAARGEFHQKPEPEQFDNEFKAKPAPKFGQPSTSGRSSSMASGRRVTQIEPFSFDSRPRTRSRINESNASMLTTKEAPAHNPGELPDYQKLRKMGTGKVQAKETTKAQGFQFRTTKRAEFKPKPTEQMTFTARRLTSDQSMRKALLGHTIKEVAKRECTVPESPGLNSKSRAKSRAAFDRALDARRKIEEEEQLERERIEKEKDDQRLIEERRALVHKPTAIRGQTPPPEIQPADKTFTQPESPQFRTSARLRARQNKKNGVSDMEH